MWRLHVPKRFPRSTEAKAVSIWHKEVGLESKAETKIENAKMDELEDQNTFKFLIQMKA